MMITRFRRAGIWTAVLLTLLAVLGVGSVSTPRAAVAATLADTPVAASAEQSVPMEDEPAFNPCAMGNLGPCDLTTTLPYGGWLTVNVGELVEPQGVACEAPLIPVRVTVAAVAGDGATTRAHTAVMVCASHVGPKPGEPFAPQVAELLPGLYRLIGQHA